MTEYRYMTAAEWGMRWARPPFAEKMPDPECYVHHSAGNHPADAVTAFRALNEYAINVKGYSALDYDVLVHRNPYSGVVTIGEGRGKWLSAATRDRNEQGEAVCVLGYFHPGSTLSRPPHPEEVEGTALAIVWAISKGWVAKDAKILGHRDNPAHPGATACPGDYLYAKLPTIRTRVAELLNPPEVVDVNWNPTAATVAAITQAPGTADVLAGKVNDWAVIAAIKALQEKVGLPVTGKWDQALGDAINGVLAP